MPDLVVITTREVYDAVSRRLDAALAKYPAGWRERLRKDFMARIGVGDEPVPSRVAEVIRDWGAES